MAGKTKAQLQSELDELKKLVPVTEKNNVSKKKVTAKKSPFAFPEFSLRLKIVGAILVAVLLGGFAESRLHFFERGSTLIATGSTPSNIAKQAPISSVKRAMIAKTFRKVAEGIESKTILDKQTAMSAIWQGLAAVRSIEDWKTTVDQLNNLLVDLEFSDFENKCNEIADAFE